MSCKKTEIFIFKGDNLKKSTEELQILLDKGYKILHANSINVSYVNTYVTTESHRFGNIVYILELNE